MPETPRIKTTFSSRYLFPLGDWEGHVEGDLVYQTWVASGLRTEDSTILGEQPAYALTNFFLGAEHNGLTIELLVKNAFNRNADLYKYSECGTTICGLGAVYTVVAPPRLVGLQFGQKF